MGTLAPNLKILVGSNCACRLIAMAGSLDKLSSMPACNI